MPYALPPLPYAVDALAPVVDAETMALHHGRHHQAYVDALNAVLVPYPDWQDVTIEDLMRRLDDVPAPTGGVVGRGALGLRGRTPGRHPRREAAALKEAAVPVIAEDNTFTQVVQFEVAPDRQERLIAAIAAEVERWVRRRPGFVSSTFHASLDGRHVLNYAQWRSEADFRAFTADPEGEWLGAAIRAVGPAGGPHAVAYRVARSIVPG